MKILKNKTPGLVFSTEHGRMCPKCNVSVSACICGKKKPVSQAKGSVKVGRETKGRKGKGVSIISGLPLDEAALAALAKELKQRCGSGGTVKEGIIEIQGDHRELLLQELAKRGYQAKRSGG